MHLNVLKTKEMVISLAKSPSDIHRIIVEESEVEQVDHCTPLEVLIGREGYCPKILKKSQYKVIFHKAAEESKSHC